ncbi:MAG: hypothetical protein JSS72_01870 [Armatimonadetes bacterium]|nr:hypothetical protein [Armatimonadota bacterium]
MQLYLSKVFINLDGRLVSPGEMLSDREMDAAYERLLSLEAVERLFSEGEPAKESSA